MIRSRNRARGWKASGGSAPAFAPTDIAGLQLWLDANDAATITQASGAVSQWNDKSGNTRHFTQATGANQPITGTRTINGKNALDFDGTNDALVNASMFALGNASSTTFCVAFTDTNTAQQSLWAFGSSDDLAFIYDNTRKLYRNADVGATPFRGESPNSTAVDTLSHINFTRKNGATSYNMAHDGSPLLGLNGGVSAITSTSIVLGNQTAGSSFRAFNGCIAEFIVYDTDLSTANRNLVGNYLATKWGITWTNF